MITKKSPCQEKNSQQGRNNPKKEFIPKPKILKTEEFKKFMQRGDKYPHNPQRRDTDNLIIAYNTRKIRQLEKDITTLTKNQKYEYYIRKKAQRIILTEKNQRLKRNATDLLENYQNIKNNRKFSTQRHNPSKEER